MPYDEKDPFDQAAWWFMSFTCEDCGTTLEYQQSQHADGSDDFFHEYAQRAKQIGWSVIPREGQSAEWQILCPVCVAKHETRV